MDPYHQQHYLDTLCMIPHDNEQGRLGALCLCKPWSLHSREQGDPRFGHPHVLEDVST